MLSETVKIKDYVIPQIYVNMVDYTEEEFDVILSIEVNMMIPKDSDDMNCIIEIKLEYTDDDKNEILSVVIRGIAEVDMSLEYNEKKEMLKKVAVPVLYKELRKFLGGMIETTKLSFPNIPPVEEIDI